MRKFWCLIVGAALLISAAGFSACAEKKLRAEYDIRAELSAGDRLDGEMEVRFPNTTENTFSSLSFELWANAYREGAAYAPVSELFAPSAYYGGASYGAIEIGEVTGAAGFEIGGEDRNILFVQLTEPLYPGECAEIGISFTTVLAHIDHRLGVGEHTINLTHFYPVLCAVEDGKFLEYVYSHNGDPFVGECADYELSLTFPAGYFAAYNGVGEVKAENGKQILRLQAENVRDIAVSLGKDLQCVTGSSGNIPVEYWYFGDETPQTTLKAACDALAYFSRTFGEYLYPRYVLVETDFPYGGMEYSGLAMIGSSLPPSERAAVVAHETAHQWWYAMVGSNQFEHAWQDEGLAEFSAALFLGAYPEYGDSYESTVMRSEKGYRSYFSITSQLDQSADTGMDRPLTDFSGEYEYRNIAYDKGVILFDRVRTLIGDRKFFSGLKNYVSSYCGEIAAPEDLIGCFHRLGADVEGLFRSFTEGKCVI